MPHSVKDHDSCRALVCALCFCEKGLKADRKVSVTVEAAIKQFHCSSYSLADSRFPTGICKSCRFLIHEWIHGKENAKPLPPLAQPVTDIPPKTRSLNKCTCRICHIAGLNGPAWRKHVMKVKKPKPKITQPSRLCSKCFSPIYRGSNHSENVCKSSRSAVENLSSSVDQNVLESIALETLKSKVNESVDKTVNITSVNGGRATKVTVGTSDKIRTPTNLSAEDVIAIQNEASLSDRQIICVLKNLRRKFGWKSVEPHLRKVLVERKQLFSDFFTSEPVEFQDKDGVPFNRVMVFCNNVVGFIELVAFLRNSNFQDLAEKVGIDSGVNLVLAVIVILICLISGKGHLKMTLTLYDPENLLPATDTSRISRKDGIGSGSSYRMTGVRKILLLAITPKVNESYHNVRVLLEKVKINELLYKFTGDLKLYNIVAGIMSASSLCPCVYCEAKREGGQWEVGARMRTFGNIMENFQDWSRAGSKSAKAKEFKNCTGKPLLFNEDDDVNQLVLDRMPPPALHLKLVVNHFVKELFKVCPEIIDWLKASPRHIVFEPYFGGKTLEGGQCSKVLNNLDDLEDFLPRNLNLFVQCLRCLRDTVDSCFSYSLDPSYREVISRFRLSFEQLREQFGVSETNKLHMIFEHVPEFIDRVGKGLGEYSEQELENAHSEWDVIWGRYLVKDFESPMFLINYRKSVLTFNADHA